MQFCFFPFYRDATSNSLSQLHPIATFAYSFLPTNIVKRCAYRRVILRHFASLPWLQVQVVVLTEWPPTPTIARRPLPSPNRRPRRSARSPIKGRDAQRITSGCAPGSRWSGPIHPKISPMLTRSSSLS